MQGVIEMVRHLGKYQRQEHRVRRRRAGHAPVNPQEIKQVVLNLITNGLDSLEPGGTVRVELAERGGEAELIVTDNGCGMTDEVLRALVRAVFHAPPRRAGHGLGFRSPIASSPIMAGRSKPTATGQAKDRSSVVHACRHRTATTADKEISDHRYQAA